MPPQPVNPTRHVDVGVSVDIVRLARPVVARP